jgi:hypothetical protein
MTRASAALFASLGIIAAATFATSLFATISIPSWLDDGISKYNAANPKAPIRFVDIKDSFVWYDMAKGTDVDHKQIRERINRIVLDHGYQPMDDEELVTTGKPPVASGPSIAKKCWSRSFVLNIEAQSNTKAVGSSSAGQRQRMLTSLVCDDASSWWAGFRTLD